MDGWILKILTVVVVGKLTTTSPPTAKITNQHFASPEKPKGIMNNQNPIMCPWCKKDTGYTQEQFMYCVITHDILCPHCQYVVIKVSNVMWTHINDRETTPYFINTPKTTYQKI
jgi:hypothetical protein